MGFSEPFFPLGDTGFGDGVGGLGWFVEVRQARGSQPGN